MEKNCRGFSVPLICFFKDLRLVFVVASINEKTATPFARFTEDEMKTKT